MRTVIALFALGALGAFAAGCARDYNDPGDHRLGHADPVIGGACTSDRDCVGSCEIGGSYPGGFCTIPCSGDRDCPSDSLCIDDRGGICMFACAGDRDCDFLGAPYRCRDRSRPGGGNAMVCFGP